MLVAEHHASRAASAPCWPAGNGAGGPRDLGARRGAAGRLQVGEIGITTVLMPMDLSVDFHFCAAHRLPFYDGPCFRMHGHNYVLRVSLTGKPNPRDGMIIDFEEVRKKTWELALNQCDHHTLNDFLDNPTENVIVWIWDG
jgi:6-pyruvoyltetrahydropterin/6-carboxytetrahydropterin synthase